MAKIETAEIHLLMHEASSVLSRLNGSEIPERQQGRSRAAEAADLTRELLRVQHLLDKAKVQVMDQYWLVKEPTATNPTGRATA